MIDKLEFLIAVARERNFRRAAESCGVTQPTLSAAIKQLEENLGVLLVNRSSRFHGLTAEGDRVLGWARRIVGDSRAMREELRGLRGALTGTLRIAVVPSAVALVPMLTVPFHKRHPGVALQIVPRTSGQIVTMLENLEIDAGITYLENQPLSRVRTMPLHTERYCLLVGRESPLAERREIGWAELGGLRLCLLTDDMQNRRIVERQLQAAGVINPPALESSSMMVLIAHVQEGGWATIISDSIAAAFVPPGRIRSIPITQPATAEPVGLILPDRDPLPPNAEALLAEARRLQTPPANLSAGAR